VSSSSSGESAESGQPAESGEPNAGAEWAPWARAARLAAVLVLVIVVAGLFAIRYVERLSLQYYALFYEQFARIEGRALVLLVPFAVVVWWWVTARREEAEPRWWIAVTRRVSPLVLAIAAGLVVLAGTLLVFHRFQFVDDEYSAWFQAVLFAHGRVNGVVAPEWCRWIGALTPTSITATPDCQWHLSFLPVYSLMRGAFMAVHLDLLFTPVVTAISILLVASVARRAWPEHPRRAWIAAAMLATSTQVLFMAMTGFSMPVHLLLDLLWLWLYVTDAPWTLLLLPWIGVLAMGAHSPPEHVLFVPPFLFRMLRRKRFGWLAYIGVVYAAGLAFWINQVSSRSGVAVGMTSAGETARTGGSYFRGLLHFPAQIYQFTTVMHWGVLATWQTPVALLCAVAAIVAWRRQDSFAHDLAASLLLALLARALGDTSQGAGWGFRFVHNELGCLALLAACGVEVLARAIGARRAAELLAVSFATTVLAQLPMRAADVRSIIAPYEKAADWLQSRPQRVVVYPAKAILWGRMLVRNDPLQEHGPRIMNAADLPRGGLAELQRNYPRQVLVVQPSDLLRFGLTPAPIRAGGILITE
jgi:hypothetical protein